MNGLVLYNAPDAKADGQEREGRGGGISNDQVLPLVVVNERRREYFDWDVCRTVLEKLAFAEQTQCDVLHELLDAFDQRHVIDMVDTAGI